MMSFGRFLAPRAIKDAALQEAVEITERWDVPHEVVVGGKTVPVPADLDDRTPRWQGMRNGRRIAGRLLLSDKDDGAPTPAAPLAFATLPVVTICSMVLASVFPPLAFVGVLACLASLWLIWRAASGRWALLAAVFAAVAALGDHFFAFASSVSGFPTPLLPVLVGGIIALALLLKLFTAEMGWSHAARLALRFVAAIAAVFVVARFVPGWAHGAWLFAPLLSLPLMQAWLTRQEWATEVAWQDIASAGETATGNIYGHAEARLAQAQQAVRNGGPLLVLGTATGFLSSRLDGYAPDAGLPFGMTEVDLGTHLMLVGETGSGKTCCLRRLIAQWAQFQLGGMLVLDGKGQLAAELRGLRGYTVIEPGVRFGLIEGLDENDLVEAIAGVAINRDKTGEGSAGFFQVNGQSVLYQGAVLLRALVEHKPDEWKWTLLALHDLLSGVMGSNGVEKIEALLNALDGFNSGHRGRQIVFANAVKYFAEIAPGMDHETKANIWSTIHGWLSPIFEHEALVDWSQTEHGVDISQIAWGAMFGVALPQAKYGRAGVLIQTLIKQRVYAMLRERGDGWRKLGQKQVLFVVDEAQELVGAGDAQFLPIARSLGGACVYASQSINAFFSRLGAGNRDAALAWLGNLVSQLIMHSTPDTMKWISEALGTTWRPHFPATGGYIRMDKSVANKAGSALCDPSHPAAKTMRWLRWHGAGKFALAYKGTTAGAKAATPDQRQLTFAAVEQVKWEDGPLMTPAEVDSKLATPFTAIAQVRRGGVRRRDVIRLQPMFEFPADLLDSGDGQDTKGGVATAKTVDKAPMADVERGIRGPKPAVSEAAKPAAPAPGVEQEPKPKKAEEAVKP